MDGRSRLSRDVSAGFAARPPPHHPERNLPISGPAGSLRVIFHTVAAQTPIPQTYTRNKTSNRRTSSRSGWPCGNKKSRDFRIQSPDRRRLRLSSRPGRLRAEPRDSLFMRERGNCNGRENPPGPGCTNELFRNPLASDGLSRVSALQNGIAVEIRWAKGFRNVLPGRDQVIHPTPIHAPTPLIVKEGEVGQKRYIESFVFLNNFSFHTKTV